MIFIGDTHVFLLSLTNADGSLVTVTTQPTIQVINARTGVGVLALAATMTVIAGTRLIYSYAWVIPNTVTTDDYFAIVSYATSTVTIQNQFLEKLRVGNSMILSTVAQDATVAKDLTTAKDATVAKSADLVAISPDNSITVQAIKAKTDLIPQAPADIPTLTGLGVLLNDIHEGVLGNLIIDRTVQPRTMRILRYPDNVQIAAFTLTDDGNSSGRTRTG